MEFIRSLPDELRLDWCLFQYSARQHHIVDYRCRVARDQNGTVWYRSELEYCTECAQPATSYNLLSSHYETPEHLTRVAVVRLDDYRKHQNTARHDALRYIVKRYKRTMQRPILSTATVESVIRALGDELECNAYQILLPQLEALVSILERHTPDLFQKREHFWAMVLLGSDRT